jgi:hypothetical protein
MTSYRVYAVRIFVSDWSRARVLLDPESAEHVGRPLAHFRDPDANVLTLLSNRAD